MSTSMPPKWKLVENVVTAIERSLNTVAGTNVIPNASVPERISGLPRQVDVYVEIPTGPRILRIGVEVRDKTSPLDLPEVEQLVAKIQKLDLDYGCIVSRAGYTASAKEEAERNGIELRTVTDIDNPNWWLASAMMLELRQVELVRWQVNFRTEELPRVTELLAGVEGTEVEMTLANGESGTLHAFIVAQGLRAVDRPELAALKDQDTFTVQIDFSQLQGASLTSPRGPVPLPQNVYALYRLHHRIESVKLVAYEGPEGVNAFTGVSSSWGKQVTLVTKLQEDGARSLSFTADDPRPPTRKIGPRK
jgi:Restriction endonuclease